LPPPPTPSASWHRYSAMASLPPPSLPWLTTKPHVRRVCQRVVRGCFFCRQDHRLHRRACHMGVPLCPYLRFLVDPGEFAGSDERDVRSSSPTAWATAHRGRLPAAFRAAQFLLPRDHGLRDPPREGCPWAARLSPASRNCPRRQTLRFIPLRTGRGGTTRRWWRGLEDGPQA
jgi:hypothetical protein